jgi:hypothetical protein
MTRTMTITTKMMRGNWGILFFSATLAVSLALCGGAAATTLARMSIAQMSQAAQAVVRARCAGGSAGWDAGEIWTFTSFEVEEAWRGAPPARITVRLLGGRVGNLTSSVAGVPRFRVGEDVVLFLERTPRGDSTVVSWEQGTFRIRRDTATGEERATQDSASFATFDPATRRFAASGERGLPLELLRARVEAAVQTGEGRQR